jgi:ubiquinone/menaquinone biosynthesis C-methylase UbiE
VRNPSDELIRESNYARAGFAAHYNAYRASPPDVLLDLLCRLARVERPALVVDLGCGTGLSTRAWSGRARRVVGVEANPAMLAEARDATPEWDVDYVEAYADATALDDACADVVTCSQSFHWMEPTATLAEVARILRPGGVFAAYDYDFPFVIEPELDAAIEACLERARAIRRAAPETPRRWAKSEHLARMSASDVFSHTREIVLHGESSGGAAQVIGSLLSIGPLLDYVQEDLADVRALAERVLGDRVVPWLVPYRVRVGITGGG